MTSLGMSPGEARERFLVQVIPVLVAAAVIAALSRERRAKAGLAALLLILLAQRRLEGRHPLSDHSRASVLSASLRA